MSNLGQTRGHLATKTTRAQTDLEASQSEDEEAGEDDSADEGEIRDPDTNGTGRNTTTTETEGKTTGETRMKIISNREEVADSEMINGMAKTDMMKSRKEERTKDDRMMMDGEEDTTLIGGRTNMTQETTGNEKTREATNGNTRCSAIGLNLAEKKVLKK